VAWLAVADVTAALFIAGLPVYAALLRTPCPTDVCATGQVSAATLRG
jgi:hypothetical protein